MKLTHVEISKFRSIASCAFDTADFATIIGPNNSGKTSILAAIHLFLSLKNPKPEDWPKNGSNEPIEIMCHFGDIKDWESSKPGVSGLIDNGSLKLKAVYEKREEKGKQKIESKYYALKPSRTLPGWSTSLDSIPEKYKPILVRIKPESFTKNNADHLKKCLEAFPDDVIVGEPIWDDESVSIKAAFAQALPKSIYIPAVQDVTEEEKAKNGNSQTNFGEILQDIVFPKLKIMDEYSELLRLAASISEKISTQSNDSEIGKIFSDLSARLAGIIDTTVSLKIGDLDTGKMFSEASTLVLNDGVETAIGNQGHGVQRIFLFALLEVLARKQATGDDGNIRSLVFLYEEPELYIHPHLLRRLKLTLLGLNTNGCQTICTTHSPFIVDVNNYKSLIITRKNGQASETQQLVVDPFEGVTGADKERKILRAVLDFHPTVCEAFFAKYVILVEGDSELALLRHVENSDYYIAKLGLDRNKINLSTVVGCGGKWTIIPIARMLKAFGIPVKVLHDKDQQGDTDDDVDDDPIHPAQANAKIEAIVGAGNSFAIDDTLEHALYTTPKTYKSDKPYRAWKRIQKIQRDDTLQELTQLQSILKFVYG